MLLGVVNLIDVKKVEQSRSVRAPEAQGFTGEAAEPSLRILPRGDNGRRPAAGLKCDKDFRHGEKIIFLF